MPDGTRRSERGQDLAVAAVRQFLTSTVETAELAVGALRSEYPRRQDIAAGFRLTAAVGDEQRRLDLLLPNNFPFAPPRVALVDRPEFLTWPHIERDGFICLLPSTAAVNAADPVGQVKFELEEAIELVVACARGELRTDFQDEFASYWTWNCTPGASDFVTLLDPQPPSRKVVLWRGNAFYVIADDEATTNRWLNNRSGENKTRAPGEAWLIWVPEPLLPNDYPKTAADVARIASQADASDLLAAAALDLPTSIVVVFGAMNKNGPCFAGIEIQAPQRAGVPGRTAKSTATNGFRKDRLPTSIIVDRYWHASTPVVRSEVVRADAAWIHGRGKDRRQAQLAGLHIVLIGCGSVGGPVAQSLSMAGVGKMTLIDPEVLTNANTGRHPLGANHVGDHKAQALAEELRRRFPHHRFDFHNATWQTVEGTLPGVLHSASVVVIATGDWNSESELNSWHLDQGRQIPIVYGWTEPHACAGHAVAIIPGGGNCLACGFTASGLPRFTVTHWQSSTVEQEPGCGAIYQPYGPAELAHTTTLVTELTLDVCFDAGVSFPHRVWACRERFLQTSGGMWTDGWMQLTNGRSDGGFMVERSWGDSACGVCGATV
jgi:sulfur-carrier protein adenylyltransferase/sulfurtransferase